MYILKNAWVSISRNKGRNLFIGIIVLVIAIATTVSLAIRSSSDSLISAYQDSVELTTTIGLNREKMMSSANIGNGGMNHFQNMYQNAQLTLDEINSYAKSNYVKDYYYTLNVRMNSNDMEAASNSFGMNGKDVVSNGKSNSSLVVAGGDFSIIGYSSINAMEDFINGNYQITDGKVSQDFNNNECVINKELAELNGIKIGDKIKFINPTNNKEYELLVTGIFSDKENGTQGMQMFTGSVNNIITNASITETIINEDDSQTLNPSSTFILNNVNDLNAFENELREKGLNENLSLDSNIEAVEGATSTISNVASFATTFLIITLIIGGIVLFVLNMINIRERKYEIGVLRTIGMKKSLLTAQFISELLIVSVVFLFLGAGIGAIVSMPVSNSLLKNEITSSENSSEQINQNFGNINVEGGALKGNGGVMKISSQKNIQAYDSIDAVVDFNVIFQLIGIGIILTLISCSAAMLRIQKFSPLTILKERS